LTQLGATGTGRSHQGQPLPSGPPSTMPNHTCNTPEKSKFALHAPRKSDLPDIKFTEYREEIYGAIVLVHRKVARLDPPHFLYRRFGERASRWRRPAMASWRVLISNGLTKIIRATAASLPQATSNSPRSAPVPHVCASV
jgi:hypothetical protein